MDKVIITIARGFGSGGKRLGSRLADDLGIHCYENRILLLASQLSGIDKEIFQEANEKLRMTNYTQSFLRGLPKRKTPHPEEREFVSDDELYSYEKTIIENLADSESCIIVGKAADWVLRDRKNVINLYVEAPRDYCRQEVMERMKISAEMADSAITSTDKYRAEYYQYYTGGNYWTNPVNYDLTINTARVGFENAVRLVEDYIKIKYPDWVPPINR
ncbi:MAG: cytidylate kinase-like family protein [Lachnospiraceae bacterium]|nr:cytidylate kinase-like family protein [Lachnospiraceae bacterium]